MILYAKSFSSGVHLTGSRRCLLRTTILAILRTAQLSISDIFRSGASRMWMAALLVICYRRRTTGLGSIRLKIPRSFIKTYLILWDVYVAKRHIEQKVRKIRQCLIADLVGSCLRAIRRAIGFIARLFDPCRYTRRLEDELPNCFLILRRVSLLWTL